MIAPEDPFVRSFRARHLPDDVVERDQVPIEFYFQMDGGRSGPQMVRQRQRPAPILRRHRSAERAQQRQRVGLREGQHGNLGERGRFGARQPLRIFYRADAGRQGIARVKRHVGHRTALRPLGVAKGALGIFVALKIAVLVRIGINEATDRAMFRRDLGLDAPPRAAIARDDDFAFHIDASFGQRFVVLGHAEIHIDQLAGNIAVDGVSVVSRQLFRHQARGRVLRQGRLLQRGGE